VEASPLDTAPEAVRTEVVAVMAGNKAVHSADMFLVPAEVVGILVRRADMAAAAVADNMEVALLVAGKADTAVDTVEVVADFLASLQPQTDLRQWHLP